MPMSSRGILIASAAFFLCSTASAIEPFSKDDFARQAAYTVVTVADWAQTRYIARHLDQFYETNPLLGREPSIGRVNNFFCASLALNAAVALALPARYRPVWQYGSIVYEFYLVRGNARIGIGMTF
jgi:hypothetical protein